jgi:GNAT superfamily N-acetyltransferase
MFNMDIRQATTLEDAAICANVLQVLRPHLEQQQMVKMIMEMLQEGYKLAFVMENNKAVAAIGYRHLHFLYNGRHIYIDDLVSHPDHRGKGYAGALLDLVEAEARAHGYKRITLDSGHHRTDAHRLYLNRKYAITAHHFEKHL